MKRKFIKILTIAAILIIPAVNIFNFANRDIVYSEAAVDLTRAYKLAEADVGQIEKEIEEVEAVMNKNIYEQKLREERQNNISMIKSQIANGDITLRDIFSDTLIVGDSLMHGLAAYNILNSDNTITMVSASLYHLADNIGTIISNHPDNIVIHYGINMLGSSDSQLEFYIELYKDLIGQLKNGLPDSEIYISSIFNVSDSVSYKFPNIADYNEALSLMCTEMGVHYIDNSELLPGDGHYYGSDGIHVAKGFYVDEWLPFLCSEMGL